MYVFTDATVPQKFTIAQGTAGSIINLTIATPVLRR